MLIYQKLIGRWNAKDRKYEFPKGQERILYRGKIALAFGGGGGGGGGEVVATAPWLNQVPYINNLFDQAFKLYQGGAPSYYGGKLTPDFNNNLISSMSAFQKNAFQAEQRNDGVIKGLTNTANNAGANPVNNVASAVSPELTSGIEQQISGQNASSNAGQMLNPATNFAINRAAFSSGPQTSFGNANAMPALDRALNSNGLNPFTDQIVNAALRTSNDQFRNTVLPGIQSQAGMANQPGGTRQGIAEGIAAKGLMNQQGDIISRLYGQAFDVGSQDRNAALGFVSQGQQANQNAELQSRNLGLQGAQIGANLINTGSQVGQNAQQAGTNTAANLLTTGNNQAMNQYFQSLGLIPQFDASTAALRAQQNQAGLQEYGLVQAAIDANKEKYFYNTLAPYNALSQYQNFISGSYGSSLPPMSPQDSFGYFPLAGRVEPTGFTRQLTGMPVPMNRPPQIF